MKAFKWKAPVNITMEQAQVYKDNWNLSEAERENLDSYFLRQWSVIELIDCISQNSKGMPVINIWGIEYIPVFTGKDMAVWDKITYQAANGHDPKPDPINNKYPMFWLSFRSGLMEGKKFSYVIIQEDRK